MTENKIIDIKEGNFEIIYVSEMEFDEEYFETYQKDFLKIVFNPNEIFFEQQINKILDSNEEMLLNEVKQIFENHNDVYKYFDYKLTFYSKTYFMYLNEFYQKVVSSVNLSIDLRLKKGVINNS